MSIHKTIEEAKKQAEANESYFGVWYHAFFDTSGNARCEKAMMPQKLPMMKVCPNCNRRHYITTAYGELVSECPYRPGEKS